MDYAQAVGLLEASVEREPTNVESWFSLGIARQKVGRLREALAATSTALRLAPDRADLHWSLGCTRALLGDRAAALASIREAIRIDPSMRAGIAADTDFASLASDPTFLALVR